MNYNEQPENHIELNCHPKIRKRRLNKRKFFIAISLLCFMSAALIIAFHLTAGFVTDTAYNEMLSVSKKASNTASPDAGQAMRLSGKLIVVDAGHGGFDPGAIGSSGSHEDELNLAVAKLLKSELEASGADVIMTRSDAKALAETKDNDMSERRRIIVDSGSDIVVSIHMNSYSDSDISGPLVIFMQGSTQGEKLAKSIQQRMNDALLPSANHNARSEDLYILRSGWQPCVLIECGYISNQEEEKKLLTAEYQKNVAKAVCEGIKEYFASI